MKKIFIGFLIFVFSVFASYYYSSLFKKNRDNIAIESINSSNNISNVNLVENQAVLETIGQEEKVSYNAEFALKKYYDECGHFTFQYAELPKEMINLTKDELKEIYNEWNIEEFSSELIILSKEIDNVCDEHFVIKLGEDDSNISIYRVGNGGSLSLYKETDISKEYLTEEDIEMLEEGILIYGIGKLNSTLEDFE